MALTATDPQVSQFTGIVIGDPPPVYVHPCDAAKKAYSTFDIEKIEKLRKTLNQKLRLIRKAVPDPIGKNDLEVILNTIIEEMSSADPGFAPANAFVLEFEPIPTEFTAIPGTVFAKIDMRCPGSLMLPDYLFNVDNIFLFDFSSKEYAGITRNIKLLTFGATGYPQTMKINLIVSGDSAVRQTPFVVEQTLVGDNEYLVKLDFTVDTTSATGIMSIDFTVQGDYPATVFLSAVNLYRDADFVEPSVPTAVL